MTDKQIIGVFFFMLCNTIVMFYLLFHVWKCKDEIAALKKREKEREKSIYDHAFIKDIIDVD